MPGEHSIYGILLFVIMTIPGTAAAQFITPMREKVTGGSALQISGIGSLTAADIDKVAGNASAQIGLVGRPVSFGEVFLSFNRGGGITEAENGTFDLKRLLYPEAANSSFMGQVELGPHWRVSNGNGDSRHDLTAFGNFAARKNVVDLGETKHEFSSGMFMLGGNYAWSIYNGENKVRLSLGLGYNSVFFAEEGFDRTRVALNEPNLPRTISGIRTSVSAQINSLVIEAQFPNLSAKRGSVSALTGYQSIIRFHVLGTFLSLGNQPSGN